MRPLSTMDFNRAPFILIWETTQACALACRHCRAEAFNRRHPDELTFREGQSLIDQAADMGVSILIFSGGDPLQRQDLDELIIHAKSRGLRTGAIPAATERLSAERVRRLKRAGLDQMALSLDAATAEAHDVFRGVLGSFEKTMEGAGFAKAAGLPLQINTVFSGWNANRFEPIAALVESLDVVFWEVFFVVPTGRAVDVQGLSPEHYDKLFAQLYDFQRRVPFIVKITEAPHYRMYVAERERRLSGPPQAVRSRIDDLLARKEGMGGSMGQAPKGVNSGKGFAFVSHTGEVFPSGFLPLAAGNLRHRSLAEIYRESEVFRRLRDPSLLKGKCGRCRYRDLCGGSRARAYALTGDELAEDLDCTFEPAHSGLSLA